MFDKRRLALMKSGAWFLNAARGALVDEAALIEELTSGRINACLDVTDPEPPAEGSPLYTLPNCILTPHVAGSVGKECLRLGDQVLREIQLYLEGRPAINEITAELSKLIG
jgi:phosphoglycerate dehydrogenase-like enzyme